MARNRARLAIGAGLVALVLGTGAAAVVMAGRPAETPETAITIEIKYSQFNPSTITVPVGVPVTITLVNDEPIDHEWIIGDGTPVHITIPTPNPWVPIRILALGKTGDAQIDADVYLLTDNQPALLPAPTGSNGMRLDHSRKAGQSLLNDLRSDRGMSWVPSDGWLTKVAIDASAPQLSYDLAVDASGQGVPSWVQAGFESPVQVKLVDQTTSIRALLAAILAVGVLILVLQLARPSRTRIGTPA